jgi:hypothetical protein
VIFDLNTSQALSKLTSSGSPINVTKVTSAALPAGCSAALQGPAVVGFFNEAASPTVDCGHNSTVRRSGR